MDFTIPQISAYAASWFGFMAGLWALFERAETVLTEETKNSIAKWLMSREISLKKDWPKHFEELFRGIFVKPRGQPT